MSLNASAILTLSEAKLYLKTDTVDADWEGVIENFINAASEYQEQLIGGKIILQDVLQITDGSGGDSLFPPFPRFVQLVGNSNAEMLSNLQTRSLYNSSWQNLFSALDQFAVIGNPAYKNFHTHLRRLDGYVFPEGTQNIRIFYKDGFRSVPEVFKQCAREMVEILWRESPYGNNDLGKSQISKNEMSQTTTVTLKSMDKRWIELIGEYIREELK